MAMDGQSKPIDVDLGGALFADGAGTHAVIAALPLAEGYQATFRNFNVQQQKVALKQVKVVGVEEVTVPAGTFKAWKVEQSSADGEPGATTLWIATDSRKVVKISATLPQMGGATADFGVTVKLHDCRIAGCRITKVTADGCRRVGVPSATPARSPVVLCTLRSAIVSASTDAQHDIRHVLRTFQQAVPSPGDDLLTLGSAGSRIGPRRLVAAGGQRHRQVRLSRALDVDQVLPAGLRQREGHRARRRHDDVRIGAHRDQSGAIQHPLQDARGASAAPCCRRRARRCRPCRSRSRPQTSSPGR